ncbi:ribosomal protein S18-domain-containing protein [Pilaira anomala]|nr:ribosomal protein S18-domain-containing protein [Pilaira anomala]
MLAQVRAFSTISRVIRAPQPTTPILSSISQPTNGTPSESTSNQRSIEEATLSLLEGTLQKDRIKPFSEATQRYQKVHHEGDTYHPEDLNDARYRESLRKRRGRPAAPAEDPFEVLGLDPLHEYKNFRLLTHFVSDMGKILPRQQTGVSAKNQRKLAKAIKRARAMGK